MVDSTIGQVGQFTCSDTLGRVETQPSSIPFVKYFSPTDYDFAFENMRKRIKDSEPLELAAPALGLFGGPLRKWLTQYIELSVNTEKVYSPDEHSWWVGTMANLDAPPYEDSYSRELRESRMDTYLRNLHTLYKEGQIPESIINPLSYTPTKDTVLDNMVKNLKVTASMAGLGIGTVAMALGGTYLFLKYGRKK